MDREQMQLRQKRPSAGMWISVCVVAIAILLAGIALGMVRPTGDIQTPPASASPERVVASYLQAMQVRDRDTMRDILVDEELVPSWTDILTRRSLRVTDVTVLAHEEVGSAVTPEGSDGHQAVRVPVEFRVTQSDGTLEEGEAKWGYLLVRDEDAEPWRIADEGTG